MLSSLSLILVSFAPGLFLIWFYVRLDKTRPEPWRLIVSTFALGGLATFPAFMIHRPLELFLNGDSLPVAMSPLWSLLVLHLLIIGPVEELCKFAAVRFGPYRSLYFDEPLDGMVYAAIASLGFASVENFDYVLEYGPEIMLARAPLSTFAHLVFASVWGYALGQHYASGEQRGRRLVGSLALAAALHGLFNVLVSYESWVPLLIAGLYPLIGGVWIYRAFRKGDASSPYLTRRNHPLIQCKQCDQTFKFVTPNCPHCGARRPWISVVAHLICGNCSDRSPGDALFCASCGDELLRK
ncbi:MAG: PrsW family glutamic-type intramembrane protease [Caldilineaceae bacterium]|nr:PrsW family glutamic-type intramembrane protease [Caldilineaceae bacterium]